MSQLGIKTAPQTSTERQCAALDCARIFRQPSQGRPSPYCPTCRGRRRQAQNAADYLRRKGRRELAPNASMARRLTATCHPDRLAVQDGRCRPCVQMMNDGAAERVRALAAQGSRPRECLCACPVVYPDAGRDWCRTCAREIVSIRTVN